MFNSASTRFLLWCLGGALFAQLVLAMAGAAAADAFSPIFAVLLKAYDTHGNAALLAIIAVAFLLREQDAPLAIVRFAGTHPWAVAAALFPLLCIGSVRAYHDHPLSMDEFAALFQAQVFAAGRLSGALPPDLIDRVIPVFFQGYFFSVARATGEVSSTYWPAFALLLAPFVLAGAPWAANPALGALAIPVLHRLTLRVTGSTEAAGWAVALAIASPAFVVASVSYYSMQAHLLANLLFALLLCTPSAPRALLAGAIGAVALTLHNPVPHLLFAAPFVAWLAWRAEWRALGALALGYVPLGALLGAGWYYHLAYLARDPAASAQAPVASAAAVAADHLAGFLQVPQWSTIQARLAGVAKMWTWASAGLLVLAAYGAAACRAPGARLLCWAFAISFFGYFLVRFDQGHGWGYRYIHAAWFALPVLAACYLGRTAGPSVQRMVAWAIALSMVFANGLRLVQVDSFIDRHLAQVPPLSHPPAERREIVFVNVRAGFYTQDLVQNDPFLRGARIVMVYRGPAETEQFMAKRFPGYAKSAQGAWGELWSAQVN